VEPGTLEIRHEPDAGRFVARVSGAEAVLAYRRLDATRLDYYHTFVPPALRGRGIASALTDHALRYAMQHGLRIVPSCPFVARHLDRHAELRSVLA
jgi:predicted GNAT family acetyltransferase